ncbi:unnamed protein product, partial [Symbiodinium pilosum]
EVFAGLHTIEEEDNHDGADSLPDHDVLREAAAALKRNSADLSEVQTLPDSTPPRLSMDLTAETPVELVDLCPVRAVVYSITGLPASTLEGIADPECSKCKLAINGQGYSDIVDLSKEEPALPGQASGA